MEFRDLKTQYKLHKEAIDGAIQKVLMDANYISGEQVHILEKQLAEYVGVKHCITCANGTDALELALMNWNIGKGDAVFVPDFTFFSSGEVVPLVGATPFFVDIDEWTYNISPVELEKTIQYVLGNTNYIPKVIVAVNLFGQPADYDSIRAIAEKYHMFILEDSAQGFGGSIRGQKACSFGDIATTSFFPAKPLGCYGDGGAFFTDNDEWAEKLRSLCVHGKGSDKYDNVRIGMNSRLDTLQAAVLSEKLKFFDEEIEKCNQVAEWYTDLLQDIVETPYVVEGYRSSWAQYTIKIRNSIMRDKIVEKLKDNGVPTAIYYRKPMSSQTAFQNISRQNVQNMNTKEICQKCLSLPMHGYLTKDEVKEIGALIRAIID